MVWITSTVDIGENAEALFPSILGSQPTWRLGEPNQTNDENGTWNGLDTPWDSESGGRLVWVGETTIDERASVLDKVLDQDTLI